MYTLPNQEWLNVFHNHKRFIRLAADHPVAVGDVIRLKGDNDSPTMHHVVTHVQMSDVLVAGDQLETFLSLKPLTAAQKGALK